MMNLRPISYPIGIAAVGLMIWGVMLSPPSLAQPALLLPTASLFLIGFVLEMGAFIMWMSGQKEAEKTKSAYDYRLYHYDEWENHSSRTPYIPPKNPPAKPAPTGPTIPFCAVSRASVLRQVSPMTMSMVQRLQHDNIFVEEIIPDRTYLPDGAVKHALTDYDSYVEGLYEETYPQETLPDWVKEEPPAYLMVFSGAGVDISEVVAA